MLWTIVFTLGLAFNTSVLHASRMVLSAAILFDVVTMKISFDEQVIVNSRLGFECVSSLQAELQNRRTETA